MVVGKKEKHDVSYEMNADIEIRGKLFTNQPVYGTKRSPKRRDVFIGEEVRDTFKKLPKTARVDWMGKWYRAKLSFRYGVGGRRIPVYQFRI